MSKSKVFVIEQGIPLPPRNTRTAGRKSMYPLDKMGIGDSFHLVCEDAGISPARLQTRIATGIYKQASKRGMTIATRQTPTGVRVWRTG